MTLTSLSQNVDRRFQALDERLDKRFAAIDARFEHIDKRFEQVDKRFEQVDQRFEQVDRRFEQVDRRFDEIGAQMRSLFEAIREDIRNYADQQHAMLERLDRFEARNDREHRLMQTQISELDAQLQSRRGRRRR